MFDSVTNDPWWGSHCDGCGVEWRGRLCPECKAEPWQPDPVPFVHVPCPIVTLEEWQAARRNVAAA